MGLRLGQEGATRRGTTGGERQDGAAAMSQATDHLVSESSEMYFYMHGLALFTVQQPYGSYLAGRLF